MASELLKGRHGLPTTNENLRSQRSATEPELTENRDTILPARVRNRGVIGQVDHFVG